MAEMACFSASTYHFQYIWQTLDYVPEEQAKIIMQPNKKGFLE